jgi:hypothetical protein
MSSEFTPRELDAGLALTIILIVLLLASCKIGVDDAKPVAAATAEAPLILAVPPSPPPPPSGCGKPTKLVPITDKEFRLECGKRAWLLRQTDDGDLVVVRRLP